MTSSNGKIFRVSGHFCGELTGDRWIPHTKASDGALVFSLICAWINAWVNNREAGDFRRHRAHYDATVMIYKTCRTGPVYHDDVIKWRHFPRNWPFVRGIHRSPVNSSHKGQWRGALMLSLICARINGRVNNGEAGDLRRYRAHCDVIVMSIQNLLGPADRWHTITWNYVGALLSVTNLTL